MWYFYNQIGAFDFNIPPVDPFDFRVLRDLWELKYKMPVWRNWQTHVTQNHAETIRAGSSPATGTRIFSPEAFASGLFSPFTFEISVL